MRYENNQLKNKCQGTNCESDAIDDHHTTKYSFFFEAYTLSPPISVYSSKKLQVKQYVQREVTIVAPLKNNVNNIRTTNAAMSVPTMEHVPRFSL